MLTLWLRIAAFVFAAAAIQLLLISGAEAQPYTAGEMLSECQPVLASAKATNEPNAIELDNTFSTGVCWGAFLTIQQIVTLKLAGARNPMFDVCVPEETALSQIIQQFDAYTREHPERLGEPFTVTAIAALHAAFPCTAGKKSRLH